MGQFIDKVGNKYGMLTVLAYAGSIDKVVRWSCLCDCGNVVVVRGNSLGSHTKKNRSCGCEKYKNRNGDHSKTHGLTGTPIYRSWQSIKRRCLNKKDPAYANYGGRGITICDEWLVFENFLADMPGFEPGLEIDRIDNNKGYSKENCRWVTSKVNNRNRRNNKLITFMGKTLCVSEWAEKIGIGALALGNRIRSGWSIERAFTEPLRSW